MKKRKNLSIFSATNSLKILSFLAENPGKQFLGGEIQKATSASRAGVYIALRDLTKQKLVLKTQRGKFLVYSVVYSEPVVRQFKVLKNILLLKPLVSKLKPFAKKIILYGSASRGEDDENSDIDLFILSKEPEVAKGIFSSIKINSSLRLPKRKIQTVVKSPTDIAELEGKEKVFYEEVNRGITLWEERT